MSQQSATATAYANIALVKYWGKRDRDRNLPAAGSFSASLDDLSTTTTISFDDELEEDVVELNDVAAGGRAKERVVAHLDLLREIAKTNVCASVVTRNDFPTAAGLASSASGFAALTLAADAALGLKLSEQRLSEIARLGSGSAARSIYGGYVEMHTSYDVDTATLAPPDATAYATQAFAADHWPLACTIAVTHDGAKEISSTDGMYRTMATSPYYAEWLKTVAPAVGLAKKAIEIKDFETLGEVAEASCLQMHASALAAEPGLLYWNGATVELIHLVRQLRREGLDVFFTIDAGPHVKIFSRPEEQPLLKETLLKRDDVVDVITTRVGGTPTVAG